MKLVKNFVSVFVGIQCAKYCAQFLFDQAYSINSASIFIDLFASLAASLALYGIDKYKLSRKH